VLEVLCENFNMYWFGRVLCYASYAFPILIQYPCAEDKKKISTVTLEYFFFQKLDTAYAMEENLLTPVFTSRGHFF